MSGVHFSIECSETQCHIRDLHSRNGTFVNEERITTAVLKSGDKITAGETSFSVIAEQSVDPATGTTPQERLLHLLRNDCQPLYVILDAARDTKILALLLQSNEQYQSLYEGQQGAKLAQVAPYLVRLPKESQLLEKLVEQGWGQSWGVYLTSSAEFSEVRRHLRHFLEVKMPDATQVYFRFYDPRVLRVYLPTCTAEESAYFFGSIRSYLVEDEKPGKLLRFLNGGRGSGKMITALLHKG